MSEFLLILICLLAGFLLKRSGRMEGHTASKVLNTFIIYLSLPALILAEIPKLLSDGPSLTASLVPISMAWIQFILSVVVVGLLGRALHWHRTLVGALVLTAGLGNTSFVGFPLLTALIGPQAIGIGVLLDQMGSFLVLSTLGILAAAYYSGRKLSVMTLILRVVKFPPFIALIIATSLTPLGELPSGLWAPLFQALAQTLVPLALVSVGLQLDLNPSLFKRNAKFLAVGLGFKLFFVPLVLFVIYRWVMNVEPGLVLQVTLVEAAMAPMITSAIVATEYELDAEVANLMVGVGIALSLVTVPLWAMFFEGVAA